MFLVDPLDLQLANHIILETITEVVMLVYLALKVFQIPITKMPTEEIMDQQVIHNQDTTLQTITSQMDLTTLQILLHQEIMDLIKVLIQIIRTLIEEYMQVEEVLVVVLLGGEG